jgi:membrane protease YdiL (CAAX protease family)
MTELLPLDMFWAYLRACVIFAVFALLAGVLLRHVILRGVIPKPALLVQPWWRKALQGLGLGAVALLPCAIIPAVLGLYNPAHVGWVGFQQVTGLTGLTGGLMLGGGIIVQTLYEELFFRAILYSLLGTLFYWQTTLLLTPAAYRADPAQPAATRWFKQVWLYSGVIAAVVVAVAFGYAHHDNSGATPLALANIALAGFALNMIFWLQGDISGAWPLHWVWNTLQVWLGLPVSGMVLAAPAFGFGASGAVPGLLTGGAFGPEGGVIATLTLGALSGWLLWRGWRSIEANSTPDSATVLNMPKAY